MLVGAALSVGVILLVYIALFGMLPASSAMRKGRNPWLWAILGLVFSLIPLIVVAVLPPSDGPIRPLSK
jgi:hypothetical protein